MSYRYSKKETSAFYGLSCLFGIVTLMLGLFFIRSQYELVDGSMIKLKLTIMIALALTAVTINIMKALGFGTEWHDSNAVVTTLLGILWIAFGFGIITQGTLRQLNTTLDKSEIKEEIYVVNDKRAQARRTKNGYAFTYLLYITPTKQAGGGSLNSPVKVHSQRELDSFTKGGFCVARLKQGYFNCPYIVSLVSRPAPEKPKEIQKESSSRQGRSGAQASTGKYRDNRSINNTSRKENEINFREDSYYSNPYSPSYKNQPNTDGNDSESTSSNKAFNKKLSPSDY